MGAYYGALLCCHLIGDYYLQGDKLVKHKQSKASGVLVHSLLYVLAFLPLLAVVKGTLEVKGLFLVILLVSHFLVDIFSRKHSTLTSFLLDQGVHLAVLFAMATAFPLYADLPGPLVGIGFSLLLIFKPSSVVVSKVLSSCASTSLEGEQDSLHAGRKIGYLERLIILLLCLFGSISTCGLVIAAKTLVRYSEFSSESNFREVFLVGTLMSITLALLGYGGVRLLMG